MGSPVAFPAQAGQYPVRYCLQFRTSLTVTITMKNRTITLAVGSKAPEFSLEAVNREGVFTLSTLLAGGGVVLEFLRGTW
jgi:hypothetical protein